MSNILVIPKLEEIEEYVRLAEKYDLGFEYNDFFNLCLLDKAEALEEIIHNYTQSHLPKFTTMHGAFYDVVPCSMDERIRQVAQLRIQQSLDAANKMGVSAVVFMNL